MFTGKAREVAFSKNFFYFFLFSIFALKFLIMAKRGVKKGTIRGSYKRRERESSMYVVVLLARIV